MISMRLPSFNIVKSAFCTCLPKYNLNTYLGRCTHRCIYCYAAKFPSFRGPVKPSFDLKEKIEKIVVNTKTKLPVMLSDSTDPYQPLERKHEITRKCLEVLAEHGFPILIATKSNFVIRDVDIFKRTPTVVSITITTPKKDVARLLEPNAPDPEERFDALKQLSEEGIPTVLRIDPIIPLLTSDLQDLEDLVYKASSIGVRQITASTMKPIRGFFKRFKERVDQLTFKRVYNAYSDGFWIAGYKYMKTEKRLQILESLRRVTLKYGLNFATCREGIKDLNTTLCDGITYCRVFLDRYMRS